MHKLAHLSLSWSAAALLAVVVVATAQETVQRAGQAASQAIPLQDWPQLGRDAQRSNYSPLQVNPPYCYIWKWYEVPFASRAQPVVAAGRLFIGGMDGVFYARNASTGAPLWTFAVDGSPIRHSAGVLNDTVVFSTPAEWRIGLPSPAKVHSGAPVLAFRA